MINCLRCELIRAKAKATALLALKWTPQEIAAKLSADYGESYYVGIEAGDDGWCKGIFRASKLSPYKPHLIKELPK